MHFSLTLALMLLVVGTAFGAPDKVEEVDEDWSPPESFKTRYPYFLSGHDREGSPVIVAEMGKWDIRAAYENKEDGEFDKYTTRMFRNWSDIGNEAPGSPGSVIVQDWDGFNVNQVSYPGVVNMVTGQLQKFSSINKSNGIKHLYAVNVNYLTHRLYDIGRPFLGSLVTKVDVFGTNPSKWKPVLLREIDANELPEFLGGSKDHKVLRVFP